MDLTNTVISPLHYPRNSQVVTELRRVLASKNILIINCATHLYKNWLPVYESKLIAPFFGKIEHQISLEDRKIFPHHRRQNQLLRSNIYEPFGIELPYSYLHFSNASHVLSKSRSNILNLECDPVAFICSKLDYVRTHNFDDEAGALFILHHLNLRERYCRAVISRFSGILSCNRLDSKPAESAPTNENTNNADYNQHNSSPIGKPVVWITPLNRDVCGGKFADRYGLFIVLCMFAIGIILELIALAILFDDGNRRLGWGIAAGSLLFWIVAGFTPMIGRLS